MKAKGFMEEQIIGVLREVGAGAKAKELCLLHGDLGCDLLQQEGEVCGDDGNMKTFDSLITNCVDLGWQLVLFALIGAVGTLAHYVLLVILVERLGIDAVIASTAGALLGAIINYVLNYRFTFNSRTSHRIALPKFLAVATVGFLFNTSLMWVAVDLINLHYILGQVITTSLVLLWNFIGNRYWTFEGEQNDARRWGI